MRIRKHAKIYPLFYPTSSLKAGAIIQTHVCQLNQSTWDVMTFYPPSSPPPPQPPPPPFQANGCGVLVGNGSSGHCISLTERELASWRESEYTAVAPKVEAAPPPPTEATVLCGKTYGKSWRCRRVAANGNSLCAHHLSMVRSYNSVGHHSSKRSAKPAPATASPAKDSRQSRPKKPATASSSDPHDFYYYSGFSPRWGGFGPRWGGWKGGEGRRNRGNIPKNVEEAASRFRIDEFDFEEEFEDEDEEDDEEEEMSRENGKKRVRKPIKARSLKSLL